MNSGIPVLLITRLRTTCYVKENRQSQSQFECLECGYTANADINGARNILAAGHAVLACGGRVQSDRPSKQEPAEVIQTSV
ncbi:zinc ribbon domain-containing protein [Proteus mirabilis]|uniref:zinc ribbon domain-containing protein n=1 Tax=Proteus mirabilis TaxID=584 RepID=UPI0011EBB18C|nr:transposase [Proteus mirabilis]HAU5539008.1 cytosine methyltransferase [Proteus mirabilis]